MNFIFKYFDAFLASKFYCIVSKSKRHDSYATRSFRTYNSLYSQFRRNISPLSSGPNSKIKIKLGIVGDGVQLGPLSTAAANRPTVPAPGDYDDGEIGGMIGRGNRSTRRKPAPVPLCQPQTPHAARTLTRAAAVASQRLTA
jgi:hypothetical protein